MGPIIESITRGNDYYLVNVDFAEYCDAQKRVDATYEDQTAWTRMSVFSVARSGIFSSDRTILQYAKEIWNIEPVRRPGPAHVSMADMTNSGVLPKEASEALGRDHMQSRVTVEKSSTPSKPKYSSVAEHIETGFKPSRHGDSTPDLVRSDAE